jgi:hypothetical protein
MEKKKSLQQIVPLICYWEPDLKQEQLPMGNPG